MWGTKHDPFSARGAQSVLPTEPGREGSGERETWGCRGPGGRGVPGQSPDKNKGTRVVENLRGVERGSRESWRGFGRVEGRGGTKTRRKGRARSIGAEVVGSRGGERGVTATEA